MPRVTIDFDDSGRVTSDLSQQPAGEQPPSLDAGAPRVDEQGTGEMDTGSDTMSAGGPPAWLIESIEQASSASPTAEGGSDAGPAPE